MSAKKSSTKTSTKKKPAAKKGATSRRRTDPKAEPTAQDSPSEATAAMMICPPRPNADGFILVVNPALGNSWSTLLARNGCTSFWSNSDLWDLAHGDVVFCYEARPTSALVAIARVADPVHDHYGVEQIVLSRGQMLRHPIPFDELEHIAYREPKVHENLRGTIHPLSTDGAEELLHRIRFEEDSPGQWLHDIRFGRKEDISRILY